MVGTRDWLAEFVTGTLGENFPASQSIRRTTTAAKPDNTAPRPIQETNCCKKVFRTVIGHPFSSSQKVESNTLPTKGGSIAKHETSPRSFACLDGRLPALIGYNC